MKLEVLFVECHEMIQDGERLAVSQHSWEAGAEAGAVVVVRSGLKPKGDHLDTLFDF